MSDSKPFPEGASRDAAGHSGRLARSGRRSAESQAKSNEAGETAGADEGLRKNTPESKVPGTAADDTPTVLHRGGKDKGVADGSVADDRTTSGRPAARVAPQAPPTMFFGDDSPGFLDANLDDTIPRQAGDGHRGDVSAPNANDGPQLGPALSLDEPVSDAATRKASSATSPPPTMFFGDESEPPTGSPPDSSKTSVFGANRERQSTRPDASRDEATLSMDESSGAAKSNTDSKNKGKALGPAPTMFFGDDELNQTSAFGSNESTPRVPDAANKETPTLAHETSLKNDYGSQHDKIDRVPDQTNFLGDEDVDQTSVLGSNQPPSDAAGRGTEGDATLSLEDAPKGSRPEKFDHVPVRTMILDSTAGDVDPEFNRPDADKTSVIDPNRGCAAVPDDPPPALGESTLALDDSNQDATKTVARETPKQPNRAPTKTVNLGHGPTPNPGSRAAGDVNAGDTSFLDAETPSVAGSGRPDGSLGNATVPLDQQQVNRGAPGRSGVEPPSTNTVVLQGDSGAAASRSGRESDAIQDAGRHLGTECVPDGPKTVSLGEPGGQVPTERVIAAPTRSATTPPHRDRDVQSPASQAAFPVPSPTGTAQRNEFRSSKLSGGGLDRSAAAASGKPTSGADGRLHLFRKTTGTLLFAALNVTISITCASLSTTVVSLPYICSVIALGLGALSFWYYSRLLRKMWRTQF